MLDAYKKVVVTGGCGFIGSHLVEALVDLSKEVVIVDNESTSITPPHMEAAHIQADVRHPEQLNEAFKGAELVYHVAANANGTLSVNDPRTDYEINAIGSFNVVEAARKAQVKRLVYVSSASIYGIPRRFPMDEEHPLRPFVPYGASKLMGEITTLNFQRTFGLPTVAGRPFCVYGPGENPALALVEIARYLRWHLRGEPIQIVGDIDKKTRDFIHVSDLVAGLLLLADKGVPGEMYNLGSGQEYSMRQVVETITEVTGLTPKINQISEITDDTYRLVGDISKAGALGFKPQMSLLDGITDLAKKLGPNPEAPGGETIFRPLQRAEG